MRRLSGSLWNGSPGSGEWKPPDGYGPWMFSNLLRFGVDGSTIDHRDDRRLLVLPEPECQQLAGLGHLVAAEDFHGEGRKRNRARLPCLGWPPVASLHAEVRIFEVDVSPFQAACLR